MEAILNTINSAPTTIITVLGAIILILAIISIVALIEARRAKKLFKSFVSNVAVDNVEELLKNNSIRLQDLGVEINLIKQELKKLESNLAFAIQSVGIVKYNAFDNVGNNLSFSLAMLDKFKNGIIITSIYGRDFTTIYGKPLQYGKSEYQLSAEEEQAVDRALKGEFKEKKLNN